LIGAGFGFGGGGVFCWAIGGDEPPLPVEGAVPFFSVNATQVAHATNMATSTSTPLPSDLNMEAS
jgi:hypothetical protein